LLTGYIAAAYGLRPEPFYPGVAFAILGLLLSAFVVRETHGHVRTAIRQESGGSKVTELSQWDIFTRTSWTDRNLSAVSQAGLVNNLNDGLAWGLFPLLYAAIGLSLAEIGWLAAIYPAVWSVGQLFTGALSDRTGRKWLIASGMWAQAAGIAVIALAHVFWGF